MKRTRQIFTLFVFVSFISILSIGGCSNSSSDGQPIPEEIRDIFESGLFVS